MITREDVIAAHERIKTRVRRTPTIDSYDDFVEHDRPISLKLELFQHTGSFKARGAFNNLLSREVPTSGVAAASGGNHGAAVAYASSQLGHKAKIFVPEISSPAKKNKIQKAGADLQVVGKRYAETLEKCDTYIKESGALSIHAYNMDETIAGQGTLALEWLEQNPDLDTMLVAVGGGGLIAGIVAACAPKIRVVAVEPENCCCLYQALKAGKPVDVEIDSAAADSLGATSIGNKSFDICQNGLAGAVIVPDKAITDAQKALWDKFQIVSEPGGATALSALTCGAYTPKPGERIGVLLCGSNTDLANFVP